MDITEKMPLSEAEEELKMLATRRRQIVEMQVQDRNRLGRTHLQRSKDSIKNFIELFQKERELFEAEMKKVIEKDKKLKRRFDILKSIPGVGDITALTLVSEMPELGLINDKKIASLAGVAPHNRDSGRIRDNARIRGGRKCARAVLYMSAMTARRHNPAIKTFYERLVENGKPKKKALIAAMRKLLVHCNHMIANDTFYIPPSESSTNSQKNAMP